MFNFLKIKNNTFTKSIWVLLLIFLFSNFSYAFQSDAKEAYLNSTITEKKFDEKVWENSTYGIDYSKQVPGEGKKRKKNDIGEPDDDGDYAPAYEEEEQMPMVNSFWSGFFKFLLILMVVVVLAFVIANMVGAEGWSLAPSNRKIKPNQNIAISLENIEEHIHETDLDRFIREALQKENHALAVRLYYLAIIKELSAKKWIKWKKDKTNRTYIRELSTTNFYADFRNVTNIFERIWYGKQPLDGMNFRANVQPLFQKMLKESQQIGIKSKIAA